MREAGGHIRDAVSIARYARETGADANNLGETVAEKIKEAAPPGSPDNPALWQAIHTYMDAYKKTNTPQQNQQAEAQYDATVRALAHGDAEKFEKLEAVKDVAKAAQEKHDQWQQTVDDRHQVKAFVQLEHNQRDQTADALFGETTLAASPASATHSTTNQQPPAVVTRTPSVVQNSGSTAAQSQSPSQTRQPATAPPAPGK
ncbi:MAG: hypothetical protein WDN31_02575 [Hyphomicrobium sp.]